MTNNRRLFNCDNRRIETHQSLITDVIQLTLTLKMTTAQVVETSVTVNNNSPIQDYVHLDDQTQPPVTITNQNYYKLLKSD